MVAVGALAWMRRRGHRRRRRRHASAPTRAAPRCAGASRQPSASADGRFVAFSSTGHDARRGRQQRRRRRLREGPADRRGDARQRPTGGTEAVGDSVAPDISADGRYVTFVSAAFLTADDTNSFTCPGATVLGPSCPDVFRHDRNTGTTIRVSVASGGAQADAASAAPQISGDGRYVVFESVATTLVAGDTNQRRDVFLRDVQIVDDDADQRRHQRRAGRPRRASPSISDDGARVAFLSDATTLDAAADPLPCDAAVLACTRVFVRHGRGRDHDATGPVGLPGLTSGAPEAFQVNGASSRVTG